MAKTVFGIPMQFLFFVLAGILGGLMAVIGYGLGMILGGIFHAMSLPFIGIGVAGLFGMMGMIVGWYVAWRLYEKLR